MNKNMLLPALLLLATSQFACAENTVSFDYIGDIANRYSSVTGDEKFSANASGFRLRLGFNAPERSRVEVYYASYDVNDAGEFDESREDSLGVNYVYALSRPGMTPFLKLGAGVGRGHTGMGVAKIHYGDDDKNLINVQISPGVGLTYPIDADFSVTGRADYEFRKWQSIAVDDGTGNKHSVNFKDHAFRFGLGIDYRF